MENRSKLVRMRIVNLGCVGPGGIAIDLDNIVCLVGANNSGKSTVLRVRTPVGMAELKPDDLNSHANGQPASVELWVHIPEGAENIDAKWKEPSGGLLLVRSKWEWPNQGGKPTRYTWEPERNEYAHDGKASGLDTVFNSRLPKPFRIGSLEDPGDEHAKLLELVLQPIKRRLAELVDDKSSQFSTKLKDLQSEAEKPVGAFAKDLADIQQRVSRSYRRVFTDAEVRLTVSLGELSVDPTVALVRSSRIDVVEPHGPTKWKQQGTGSQRALFWSMLEVRSELNRLSDHRRQIEKSAKDAEKELRKRQREADDAKTAVTKQRKLGEVAELEAELARLRPKDGEPPAPANDAFLPGFMLLIDEPETALHPNAIRAAKDHLYSLAEESGWQVMLSTHHPAFLDPLKDHTTIVRVYRSDANAPPNVYRTDDVAFSADEKDNLKALLAFDSTVAEMFFGSKVIVVEGDTEFAAFTEVMNSNLPEFPIDGRPLIIRARGKATIPILIKMLTHFKLPFSILHDIDSPKTSGARGGTGRTART